jgi:hypothetical protein
MTLQWATSAVIDHFFVGHVAAARNARIRARACIRHLSGRYVCRVSWRKGAYAYAGMRGFGGHDRPRPLRTSRPQECVVAQTRTCLNSL